MPLFLVKFLYRFRVLFTECRAATAIEYALMAAAIAFVIIVIVFAMGGRVDTMFTAVDDALAVYI